MKCYALHTEAVLRRPVESGFGISIDDQIALRMQSSGLRMVTLRPICSIQDSSGRVVMPATFTTRSARLITNSKYGGRGPSLSTAQP